MRKLNYQSDLIAQLRAQWILADVNYRGAKEAYREGVMSRAWGAMTEAGIHKGCSLSIVFKPNEAPKVVRYIGLSHTYFDREDFILKYEPLNKNGKFSVQDNYIELSYSEFENGVPQGITKSLYKEKK